MKRRIASTVILWAVVIAAVVLFHTAGAVALIVALSVLTLRELYRLLGAAGNAPFSRFGMFFGALITASPWMEARFGAPAHPLLAFAAVILCI
jgi:phosphatidate cytidylyltransferase